MPLYSYQCEAGHTFDAFNRVATREDAPACTHFGCEAKTRFVPIPATPPAYGDKPWKGVASESVSMLFQEAGIDEIKRDCPSMEFVRDKHQKGTVRPKFNSDKHHRQCLRELERARQKYASQGA